MYRFKMEVAMVIAAWAFAAVGQSPPLARNGLSGLHSRGNYDMTELQAKLSSSAKIYYPNSTEFDDASARWSLLDEPKVNVVVVPGTENDVAETVGVFVRLLIPCPGLFSFSCFTPRIGSLAATMGPRILSTGLWTDSASGTIRQQARLALPRLLWGSWVTHLAGQNGPGN